MDNDKFLLLRSRLDSYDEYPDSCASNFDLSDQMYERIQDLRSCISELQDTIADELGVE